MQKSPIPAKNAATFRKKKARSIKVKMDHKTYKKVARKLDMVMNQKNTNMGRMQQNANPAEQQIMENRLLAVGLIITMIGLTICMITLLYK